MLLLILCVNPFVLIQVFFIIKGIMWWHDTSFVPQLTSEKS